jgi:branched-chain amino acid transport system ATP-binding protein
MGILEVEGLSKNFGGLAANRNLHLDVEEGEIRGVIGPNGAGKTTFFNVVSGIYRPSSGTITFDGQVISNLGPDKIAALGVVRTFQRVALFPKFTVLENVNIGRHLHARESIIGAVFGRSKKDERETLEKAEATIDFLGMTPYRGELSSNLPYGLQRTLGVAIALAAEPRLLMLDEPVAGMNDSETLAMTGLIRRIRDEMGITVLLVEHDMRTVMNLCDKITVLDFGEKLAEGLPHEIRANKDVIEAYLGAEDIVA